MSVEADCVVCVVVGDGDPVEVVFCCALAFSLRKFIESPGGDTPFVSTAEGAMSTNAFSQRYTVRCDEVVVQHSGRSFPMLLLVDGLNAGFQLKCKTRNHDATLTASRNDVISFVFYSADSLPFTFYTRYLG